MLRENLFEPYPTRKTNRVWAFGCYGILGKHRISLRAVVADCVTADGIEMAYSGNKLHPTQKPVTALAP
jgi:hypothetical protein